MSDILPSEILARYVDARIPRYTSYPTAPNFSPEIREGDYRSWLASLPPVSASLYLHVPFCRAMCWYCGCHTTVAVRDAPVDRYIGTLRQEIELVSQQVAGPVTINHIHFGGGTPTLMSACQLRSIMHDVRQRFTVAQDSEIAIEIDPRTLAADTGEVLGACGFNRASLGVQTFDVKVQRAINRVQSFEETRTAVQLLRRHGVQRINFDLVYGLPHQSLTSCLETVDQSLALRPDRLAVFGYAHLPAFKPHQRKISSNALPDSELRFTQSRAIAEALIGAGYVEIGLDHFALPDDALSHAAAAGRLHRNFQGYTTDDAEVLIGVGASSIGRMPQGFIQNEVRISEYQRLVAEGRLPMSRGYRFVGDDRLRGEVIERLMCDHRVDLHAVCRPFGADPATLLASAPLQLLISDGLVVQDAGLIIVESHARSLIRSVAAAFDAYLTQGDDRHSRAV